MLYAVGTTTCFPSQLCSALHHRRPTAVEPLQPPSGNTAGDLTSAAGGGAEWNPGWGGRKWFLFFIERKLLGNGSSTVDVGGSSCCCFSEVGVCDWNRTQVRLWSSGWSKSWCDTEVKWSDSCRHVERFSVSCAGLQAPAPLLCHPQLLRTFQSCLWAGGGKLQLCRWERLSVCVCVFFSLNCETCQTMVCVSHRSSLHCSTLLVSCVVVLF